MEGSPLCRAPLQVPPHETSCQCPWITRDPSVRPVIYKEVLSSVSVKSTNDSAACHTVSPVESQQWEYRGLVLLREARECSPLGSAEGHRPKQNRTGSSYLPS